MAHRPAGDALAVWSTWAMTRLARCRAISTLTLVLGAAVLAWSLALSPGDPRFYAATALLATIWLVGALLARRAIGRPLRRVVAEGRTARRDTLLGLGVGLALCAVFLVGAGIVTLLPSLRTPVDELLAHSTEGATALVLALTLVNGYAEELFFRGALFEALDGALPAVTTTLVYTVVIAGTGIWLLALAGMVVGGTAAWLRVRTGGTTAGIIAHSTWSAGMFFLLSPVLALWS